MSDVEVATGFARSAVPESARGSGWKTFFIVAGSMCGLPVFVLSTQLMAGLGFVLGIKAAVLGGAVSGALAALSSYVGSRSRVGVALLADAAFGHMGAKIIKLLIAISLIGWFGVATGTLGANVAGAVEESSGRQIPTLLISLPLSVIVALVAVAGASGLEKLGKVVIPATVAILVLSVSLTLRKFIEIAPSLVPTGAIGFGEAVSAVIGSYIVGILIQPDYSRFVAKPLGAAAGSGGALAIMYPMTLILASIASLALGKANLIVAVSALGFTVPALAVMTMGAWIDASACLYSGSLSITNMVKRASMPVSVIGSALLGCVLVIGHMEAHFVPFLILLSIGLPPVAAVQISQALIALSKSQPLTGARAAFRLDTLAAWIAGTAAGALAQYGVISLSSVPALDSILVSVALFLLLQIGRNP
jgi:cytosine permease